MSACSSFSSASVSMGAGAAPDVLMPVLAPRASELNYCSRLPRSGLGCCFLFPGLAFTYQTRRGQQLAHIEKNDQPPSHFSQPRHAIQSAFLEYGGWSFHRVGRNLQDFRGRIHDEPGEPSGVLYHEDAIVPLDCG